MRKRNPKPTHLANEKAAVSRMLGVIVGIQLDGTLTNDKCGVTGVGD